MDQTLRLSSKLSTKGNFEILEEIATGGMAIIYKARQKSLNRTVILKMLQSDFKSDPEAVARFSQEAIGIAKLQHENIINVIDYWNEGGSYYIAMEYLDGADLSKTIDKLGPLPLNIGLIVGYQIAKALEYAHDKGVVHRDIKPSNILLSREGMVKVTDFGISHMAEELGGRKLTHAGDIFGTPSYMSPEQIEGEPMDFHTDIFSFGSVLFEIFTMHKAFEDDQQITVTKKIRKGMIRQPRELNPKIPRKLQKLILCCLKRKPKKRPSASMLRSYLQTWAEKENKGENHSRILKDFLLKRSAFDASRVMKTSEPGRSVGGLFKGIAWAARRSAFGAGKIALVLLVGTSCYFITQKIALAPVSDAIERLHARASTFLASFSPLLVRSEAILRESPEKLNKIFVDVSKKPKPVPEAVAYGHIRIKAVPWAYIRIDGGEEIWVMDRIFQVSVGTHSLIFRNPGYNTFTHSTTITRKDELKHIKVDFEKSKHAMSTKKSRQ